MGNYILNNTTIVFTNLVEPDRFNRYGVVVSVPDVYQLKPFTTHRKALGISKDTVHVIRCALRKQDVEEKYRALRRGDKITLEVRADSYILNGKEHIYPSIINILPVNKT
jgi:hypothetical protein